jgi:hypothetical protein
LWGSTSGDRGNSARKYAKGGKRRTSKGGLVDAEFIKRIKKLLKIVIPSYTCKESKYIAILTLLLILRTQMSIWLADVNGRIVKSIVERNWNLFLKRVSQEHIIINLFYLLLDLPIGFIFHSVFSSELGYGLLCQTPFRCI